jgi:hypothetical protein
MQWSPCTSLLVLRRKGGREYGDKIGMVVLDEYGGRSLVWVPFNWIMWLESGIVITVLITHAVFCNE